MLRRSRRRFSAAWKAQIVEEASRPGASTGDLSARYGLDRSTINKWLREVRCAGEARSVPPVSFVYLTRNVPEPDRSALLAKIETERDRLLRIIERLSQTRG